MAQTATNPQTGEKVEWNGSAWVPLSTANSNAVPSVGRTATNPKTGERIAWDGKAWVPLKSPGYGALIEAGVRQGAADIYSLPNIAGQLAAQRGPTQVPQQIRGMPAQQRPVEQMTGLQAVGSAVAGATPTREELMARAERNVGPMAEPVDPTGRMIVAGARAGTGGLIAGPAGVLGGTISGVAGQGAAELGAPQWAQILASIGVPIGGAGIISAGRRVATGTADAVWKQALRDLPREQFDQAAFLHQEANRLGARITPAEAIALVTNRGGSAQTLLALQRVVEGSPGGKGVMGDFMAQRGPANEAMMTRFEQQLGGRVQGQPLSETPQAMKEAAQGAGRRIKGAASAQSRPLYTAAANEVVDPGQINNIVADLNELIERTGAAAARRQLEQFRDEFLDADGLPITNIGRLDSVRKSWRDRIELPDISASAIDKEVAAKIGPQLSRLRGLMEMSSENYRQARFIAQNMQTGVVGPTERTALGTIASEKQPSMTTQMTALMPRNPAGLDENTIRFVVNQMGQQNPEGVQRFVRSALRSEFDKATRAGKSPVEQWGGASFALNLTGNTQQARNIEALIRTAYGDMEYTGFRRMIDVLQAQGTRQAPGSLTAENIEAIKGLSGGRLPISVTKPIRGWQEWVDRVRYGYNTQKLADLLVSEDAMDRLRQLAMTQPGTERERFLIGTIIGANQGNSDKGLSNKGLQ